MLMDVSLTSYGCNLRSWLHLEQLLVFIYRGKAYESAWPRELAANHCQEKSKSWPREQGDPGWKNTRFKGGITWGGGEETTFPV